ncbi:MAG: nucleotidyl transferase AbiEii/AbiGii toxin family protein [Iamia sp.]
MRITEGHLARHYQGRKGGRGPALLDLAQDHAIAHLHAVGLFEAGLVFKGGTSLRKFRAGSSGRFSTDLDFFAPDDDVTVAPMEGLADVTVDGFASDIPELDGDGRRARLDIDTPFGRPDIGARIEVSQLRCWPTREARWRPPAPAVVATRSPPARAAADPRPLRRLHPRHSGHAIEEAVAEKLARFRRVSPGSRSLRPRMFREPSDRPHPRPPTLGHEGLLRRRGRWTRRPAPLPRGPASASRPERVRSRGHRVPHAAGGHPGLAHHRGRAVRVPPRPRRRRAAMVGLQPWPTATRSRPPAWLGSTPSQQTSPVGGSAGTEPPTEQYTSAAISRSTCRSRPVVPAVAPDDTDESVASGKGPF